MNNSFFIGGGSITFGICGQRLVGALAFRSLHQTTHVAECKQAAQHRVAGFAVVFSDKLRDMIGPDWAAESDLVIRSHRSGHVGGTVVVKCFRERVGAAFNVAEMDVLNVTPEVPYRCWDINIHCGE